MKIYLDNAATTEPYTEALTAAFDAPYGNPSSMHALGELSKECLDIVRDQVKEFVGCPEDGTVIFTSGATEANNIIQNGSNILSTAIEHPSVYGDFYLKTYRAGIADTTLIEYAASDIDMVSVQAANSETGVIQFINRVGDLLKDRDILYHVDATQAVGFKNWNGGIVNMEKQNIDTLTFSAHKIHGLKGTGCLVLAPGVIDKINPIEVGGGQEYGIRPGTQNVPGILALGEAIERISKVDWKSVENLRDYLEKRILDVIPDTLINGTTRRVPTISNILFKDCRGEQLVELLSENGIYVSSGSACSSGKPSKTLLAMGRTKEEAESSLRFSLSEFTTKEELDFTVEVLKRSVALLRGVA